MLIRARILVLVGHDDGITTRQRSGDDGRGAKQPRRLRSKFPVSVLPRSRPRAGVGWQIQDQMVSGSNLIDQAVDRSDLDPAVVPTRPRRKHVTGGVRVREDQDAPVTYRAGPVSSEEATLECLATSGWCFNYHQVRRRPECSRCGFFTHWVVLRVLRATLPSEGRSRTASAGHLLAARRQR